MINVIRYLYILNYYVPASMISQVYRLYVIEPFPLVVLPYMLGRKTASLGNPLRPLRLLKILPFCVEWAISLVGDVSWVSWQGLRGALRAVVAVGVPGKVRRWASLRSLPQAQGPGTTGCWRDLLSVELSFPPDRLRRLLKSLRLTEIKIEFSNRMYQQKNSGFIFKNNNGFSTRGNTHSGDVMDFSWSTVRPRENFGSTWDVYSFSLAFVFIVRTRITFQAR